MTRDEVIQHLCETVSTVYMSIDEYSIASDGFCHLCPAQKHPNEREFVHGGATLKYVRDAVVEKLTRDGYQVKEGWRE